MRLIGWIVGVFVAVFLLAYFVAREVRDPWLFAGASPDKLAPAAPADAAPRPDPRAAETLAAQMREDMLRSQLLLSGVMEEKLLSRMERMSGSIDAREAAVERIRTGVAQFSSEMMQVADSAAAEINVAVGEVERNLAELNRFQEELDLASEGIGDAVAALEQIGQIAGDISDAANYVFHDYTVVPGDTLAAIARKMQIEHNVPEADMVALIRMFNDVTTRTRVVSTRRPPIREVSNEVLRIPVPLRAGDLFAQTGSSARLGAERDRLIRVSNQQQALLAQTADRIQSVRAAVADLEILRSLADGIGQNLQLLADGRLVPAFDQPAMSADEAEAWQLLSDALNQLSIGDGEYQITAQNQLQQALLLLKQSHQQRIGGPDLSGSDPDILGTIEWYERFRDRYRLQ